MVCCSVFCELVDSVNSSVLLILGVVGVLFGVLDLGVGIGVCLIMVCILVFVMLYDDIVVCWGVF